MSERCVHMDDVFPLIEESLAAGQCVRFYPRGRSMLPILRQGLDSVVLSPLPKQLKKYDVVLFRRTDGQFVLHRLVRIKDGYTFIGDNQFTAETVAKDQLLAVMTSFKRGQREIPVTSVLYRLYAALWCLSRPGRRFAQRAFGWLRRHLFPNRLG